MGDAWTSRVGCGFCGFVTRRAVRTRFRRIHDPETAEVVAKCVAGQTIAIYIFPMSAAEIIDQLPKLTDAERRSILEKLRELMRIDDERWEAILNDATPRPKLDAFVRKSKQEGESPLDLSRL